MLRLFFLLSCVLGVVGSLYGQARSVLAEGHWVKVGITQTGVYRLEAPYLQSLGFNLRTLDPRTLRLYGNGGFSLPQANSAPRPTDLQENAIWVSGEDDGRFDASDALYFYAESPHRVALDSSSLTFYHERNPYSDTTYFFLTAGGPRGLRLTPLPPQPIQTDSLRRTFTSYWYHERDETNLLQSGRAWWGEFLGISGRLSLDAVLMGVVPGSSAWLRAGVLAAAQVPTTFRWSVNGLPVGEQTVGTVTTQRYDLKGIELQAQFRFQMPTAALPSRLPISVVFDKNGQLNAQGYLNYVGLQVQRVLSTQSEQVIYRFLPDANGRSFVLKNPDSEWVLWEVSDPHRPQHVTGQNRAGEYVFGLLSHQGTVVGFRPSQAFRPQGGTRIPNQSLHSLATPELLIITPLAWVAEARRLAAFRRQHSGLTTEVLTVEAIYNEWGSGQPDPTALRDCIRFFYTQAPQTLQYVLLMGDATYDYKGKTGVGRGIPYVPIYQSRESLQPLFSYSSDDYFGFMESHEGEWLEAPAGDHTLDVSVGRLPVKTIQEAQLVVDKLIHYESAKAALGPWRSRMHFVADDGDGTLHESQASTLAEQISPVLFPQKLFLDAIAASRTPTTPRRVVNEAIRRAIQDGTLILNYTGHGGPRGWAEEQVWGLSDIATVGGYNNLPLLFTATCEFGRYDDPALVSGAELMVLSPRGAAIGAVTTTRPVFASTNFALSRAFYEALAGAGPNERLGDIFRKTKNNSLRGSLNRNFSLLGDPAMRLAVPEQTIRWTHTPDTLQAGRKVTLAGGVFQPDGITPDEGFDGKAYLSVYEARQPLPSTVGARHYAFRSKLFEGVVSVRKGVFSCTFTVPEQVGRSVELGHVSIYAVHATEHYDAAGQLSIPVGGTWAEPVADTTPPSLNAYINERSFQDGSTVGPNPIIWIETADPSGITLSQTTSEHSPQLVLNDTLLYRLADYYQAELDNSTRGRFRLPLHELNKGLYKATVRVVDGFGNVAGESFRFVVGEGEDFTIEEVKVYPNPFSTELSFSFEHTYEENDLDVTFRLYTLSGQLIGSTTHQILNSARTVQVSVDGVASFGKELSPYTEYLYQLSVRCSGCAVIQMASGRLWYSP